MKKQNAIAAILATIMLFSGCGGSGNPAQNPETTAAETSEVTTTAEEKKAEEVWELRHYVDEFDNPTNETYMTGIEPFSGRFSNSATTNSELLAVVLLDRSYFCVKLYKYGRSLEKNSSKYADNIDEYSVTMLDTDEKKTTFKAHIYPGDDRLVIDGKNDIIKALKKEGKVSFYIEEKDNPVSNYRFTVETGNFEEVYQVLINSV